MRDTAPQTNEGNGNDFDYDPDQLLDNLKAHLKLKNDRHLARTLEVAPPIISKIRHRRLPIGAAMLVRMHEISEISIKDLRHLMGDHRAKFLPSDPYGKARA